MSKIKKFKVNINWLERHGGSLLVKADSKEEAIALLKSDENRLLELMIDKYANETFDYVDKVTVLVDDTAFAEDAADLDITNK